MKHLLDNATMKLLTDSKLAVYRHLQAANKDIRPEDISFCVALYPSTRAVLRCGDAMFIAELTADKAHIEVRELETVTCSVWDVLQSEL